MKKELAKFASGLVAADLLLLFILRLEGLLPLDLGGITLTPEWSIYGMIIDIVLLALLFYYAWVRK